MSSNYKHTLYASYLGYVTQAIINNLAPLLFLTFQRTYHISFAQIGFLLSLNFGIQLLVDLLSVKYIDRIGYRRAVVWAHILAAVGLICLFALPELLPKPYTGLMIAICIYAIGGGALEVLISPIVEACPTEGKASQMSLLHSFYCWGHVLVVLLSTIFFQVFGIENWNYLVCFWAIVPLFNAIYFSKVPINKLVEEESIMPVRALFSLKTFWIFILLMICAGASEQAMSQWASAFAESGLGISKTMGDLLGPCLFAILMGTSRVLYSKYSDKINLKKGLFFSGLLCIMSYCITVFIPNPMISLLGCGLCGFSVGILWPGTFSLASTEFKQGGTALFALLAFAGDIGCSAGPGLVGKMTDIMNGSLKQGLIFGIIFPILLIIGISLYIKNQRA